MPLTLPSATVETDRETSLLYEWALDEFETNDRGRKVKGPDGKPIRINPLNFPLHNAMVVVNGSRATISIPRAGKSNCIVDRLMRVAEPKVRVVKGRRPKDDDSQAFTISGVSEEMLKRGAHPDDAIVTFHVTGHNVTEPK